MLYNILKELGLEGDIEFIELTSHSRIIGSDYDVPFMALERLAEELKRMFPGEGIGIDAFVQDCKAFVSEMLALAEPAPDPLGFGGKLGLIMKFLFKSPRLRRYGRMSYRQALAALFKEPKWTILGAVLDYDPGWAATSQMLVVGFPGAFITPKAEFRRWPMPLPRG